MLRAPALHGRRLAAGALNRHVSKPISYFALSTTRNGSSQLLSSRTARVLDNSKAKPIPSLNHALTLSSLSSTTNQQIRSYIFLPSSFNDATKLLKDLASNPSSYQQYKTHLFVKLKTRWQDSLLRMLKHTEKIQKEQRNKFAARLTRFSARRERFAGMAANGGVRLNRGKRLLMSHVNAKKRIYTRRRLARMAAVKLARTQWMANMMKNSNEQVPSISTLNLNHNESTGGITGVWMKNLKLRYSMGKQRLKKLMSAAQGDAANSVGSVAGVDMTNSIGSSSHATWMGITLAEPAQRSWFDLEGYPLTSRDPETGRFVNPWSSESSNGENGLKKFLRWKFGKVLKLLEDSGIGPKSDIGHENERCDALERSHTAGARGSAHTHSSKGRVNTNLLNGLSDSDQHTDSSATLLPSHPYSTCSSNQYGSNSSKTNQFHDDLVRTIAAKPDLHQQPTESIQLTWIGHSTTLVKLPGSFTILTDPHFSNYAGPIRRNVQPSLSVADLPDVIDAVLISHDHMDHLDYWSILELIDSNKVEFWVVPLGIKAWLMNKAGVAPEDIVELEWWEGVRISKTSDKELPKIKGLVKAFEKKDDEFDNINAGEPNSVLEKSEMVVTCAPAQHWCSRSPFDRNKRLWCSWAVRTTPKTESITTQHSHSFYFAGDTGLPPEFPLHHQIGDRLGPFDLAAIPIGAYEPQWFMREAHCNPAEAVKIHQAIRSRKSVAIHFDTFDLADEPREEPPKVLLDEVRRVNNEIIEMAVDVAAVVDEVGVSTALGQMEVEFGDILSETSTSPSVQVEQRAVAKAGKQLIEALPPLVDFAVISQGQSVESG